MELPEPSVEELEEFVANFLTPSPLHSRFQTLTKNVWIWGQQMRKNSKYAKSLSEVIHSAVFAYSHVVTYLDHVIIQYYDGKTTCSSLDEVEKDLKDLEIFASVICGQSDEKLILKGPGDRKMMVFPKGAPFFSLPKILDLYCLTGLNGKANKLLDVQLKRKFQDALRLFSATMFNSWPHLDKVHFGKTLAEDQRVTFATQLKAEARIRELDKVRSEILLAPRNAICHDRRVKGWVNKISMASACEETGIEIRELKAEVEKCRLQGRFYEQICTYYSLEPDAGSSAAAAAAAD